MAKKTILEILHDITQPVVQSFNLVLWGIDVLQSGKTMVRIYIDVPSGLDESDEVVYSATVEQCARISRLVGLALEVEDVFSSPYVLEVSSPGLTRPFFKLEQMEAYIGDNVEIVLGEFLMYAEHIPAFAQKRKKFSGELMGIKNNNISLKIEHGGEFYSMDFNWDNIRKAMRVHVFIAPEKPGKKRKNA